MSHKRPSTPSSSAQSLVFAALGDKTRLSIISKLSNGRTQSISHLARNSSMSRQAVTKHLHVLEDAGIVRSIRVGRESQFKLELKPINDSQDYLEYVSNQWDDALKRLKSLVED